MIRRYIIPSIRKNAPSLAKGLTRNEGRLFIHFLVGPTTDYSRNHTFLSAIMILQLSQQVNRALRPKGLAQAASYAPGIVEYGVL